MMNPNRHIISYSIFFISFLFSCDNSLKNSVKTTFYTQDSIYKITFDKPIELDTFYTWLDEDDNACSDEHKYRFSKKEFPHQKERGFFSTSFVDSTYRMTLKHVEGFNCKSGMDNEKWMDAKTYLNNIFQKSKSDNPKVNLDTLYSKNLKINKLEYVLVAYKIKEDFYVTHDYSNGYWTTYLKALTVVDNNFLGFSADCRTKNCDDFLVKMEKCFETIKIENK